MAGFKHYYVIKVLDTGATAYVPIRKTKELGMQPVMSLNKLAQVLFALNNVPCELSNKYKTRQERIREKRRTGRPIPVAETVRNLTWRKARKRLSQGDSDLLKQGQEFLASEMALATDTQISEAQETIDIALRAAIERIRRFGRCKRVERGFGRHAGNSRPQAFKEDWQRKRSKNICPSSKRIKVQPNGSR